MARKAREKSSTGKYVIMLKGTEDTLFKSKAVKESFIEYANKGFPNRMLGIRFFGDRVIMLVSESEKGISADMKPITISFARAYNKDKGLDGKVFADRFKSLPVETAESEADCMAFINGDNAKDPFETKTTAAKTVKKTTAAKKTTSKPKATPKTETVSKAKTVEKPSSSEKKAEKPKTVKEKKIGRDKSGDLPYWLL